MEKKIIRIFIGSSNEVYESGLLLDIARIIEECKMIPVRWNQSPSIFEAGSYTLEALEEMIKKEKIDASIFIFSSDDMIWYRGENVGKARDNVVFEHGLFSGILGRNKSIIIRSGDIKMPSDLLGITHIDFSEGQRAKGEINLRNWLLNLQIDNRFEDDEKIPLVGNLKIRTFRNLEAAKPYIEKKLQNALEIRILANKGLEFFGTDNSIVSLAETSKYEKLKRLKIVLLSTDSSWINRGLMALRKYETIEDFKNELKSTQMIVEMGMKKILKDINIEKSGIKYHEGEPYFRFIMIDDTVFVSSYAENPTEQVRDLPVFEIRKDYGSLYGALRKHFNDLWVNNSKYGKTYKEYIEIEVSAGGIVFYKHDSDIYIALVQRDDGSWVLPKGHKKTSDESTEKTAIREVAEETGLEESKLRCIRKLDSYSYDEVAVALEINKINHFYLIEYVTDKRPELQTDFEHLSAKMWNIKDELPYMFYVYQKILISETILNEFGVELKMDKR